MDEYITLGSFTLLVVYHIFWQYNFTKRPLRTTVGCADLILKEWVANIYDKSNSILAVQTLRNWTMASTLLASTSILLALGIMNYIFNQVNVAELSSRLRYLNSDSLYSVEFKLLLVVALYVFAFLNFSLALRTYSRVGFMLGLPKEELSIINKEGAAKTLIRGARHFTMGMRGYYHSIPIFCWLFGPSALLVASIILILFLFNVDYREAQRMKGI